MATGIVASDMLAHEARALLARLARIKPFVITETMVPAAAVSPRAVTAIERYLATGRRELRARVNAYLKWLATPAARDVPPATLQQRFTFLRLRFNAVLTQFDIFADVLSQRSQLDNGLALVMKIATNLSLAVQMLAFSEGVLLAEKSGIRREVAVDVMTHSVIASPMRRASSLVVRWVSLMS